MSWEKLELGLNKIIYNFDRGITKEEYIILYTEVYNYCTNSNINNVNSSNSVIIGNDLYQKVKVFIINCLDLYKSYNDYNFDLEKYLNQWDKYYIAFILIDHIFMYLNRHWIKKETKQNSTIYNILYLTIILRKKYLFIPLHKKIINEILSLINKDRNNEIINQNTIKRTIDSLIYMENNVYQDYFEESFLINTGNYYNEFVCKQYNFIVYMNLINDKINNEEKRITTVLQNITLEPLKELLNKILIENKIIWFQDNFSILLKNDDLNNIALMYKLINRLKIEETNVNIFYSIYEEHIGNSLKNLININNEDLELLFTNLFQIYVQYKTLSSDAFLNNTNYICAMDKAFKSFVNFEKMPELLAKYCDTNIKKDSNTVKLINCMNIFKYIENKDVFQLFYSKFLAKRLINNNTIDNDNEHFLIDNLKTICGISYVSKMQKMFQDIILSKELNIEFSQKLNYWYNQRNFNMLVLTGGSWPLTGVQQKFNIPENLLDTHIKFSNFYQNKYSGRKLTCLYNLSTVDLKAQYGTVNKEFHTSTIQMVILMNYNNNLEYTLEQLTHIIGLDEITLKQILSVLVKMKILFLANNIYILNENFTNKKFKLNINVNAIKNTKLESDDTHKTVKYNRSLLLQACIVRVMKTRKSIKHVLLIDEIINNIKHQFKPQIPEIKKAIDILLEKDYIERNGIDVYNYLA